MSTTMPSASSDSPRKVASTTYVAPCNCCAGPKTSPRRLCAIIMWSRTFTRNMSLLPVVADRVAQRGEFARGEFGQHVGQRLERGRAGEQRIEGRVAEQLERECPPLRRRAV